MYFGNFALDNINGVRFEDNGRYYVNASYGYPYILDFHNKKVIKLFNEENQISKGSLLSRAMKENLLHSGNKEKIDYLNIVFTDALKELLQCRKKALQYIACCYGYDFQKPFKVTGLLGKFTANSIKKITGNDDGILLVCKGTEVRCVKLNKGKFDTDVEHSRETYNCLINYYYRKYDFESDRKSGELGVFIVQQDAKYKREVKRSSNSYSYYHITDVFDKSGFNITETREQLQSRLRKYKADKKKKEVDLISYETDLKEIKKMFQTLKEKIILKLTEAQTSDKYKNVENVFDFRFIWMIQDMEKFERKVTQNGFDSVEEATDSIKELKEKITEKIKMLN